MAFDISYSTEVVRALDEIRQMRRSLPNGKQSKLSEFITWKAYSGPNGKGYVLQRQGTEGFDSSDGFFLTNLVLQGGGTLGLAHAGFIAGLEEAGFRFPGLAGTSAGAIVAAGVLALRKDDILARVGDGLTELVSEVPMDTFVDGPRAIRRVVKRFAAGRNVHHPLYWPGILASVQRLLRTRGLNTGYVFQRWMKGVFEDNGLATIADLNARTSRIASDLASAQVIGGPNPFTKRGGTRGSRIATEGTDLFKLISTAMPTGSKFCLPRDLLLLDDEYSEISPALLVRMSMSIPAFFEPCKLRIAEVEWKNFVRARISPFVSDRAALQMSDLKELVFLDGGLFSNLPTDELIRAMSDEIPSISVPLVATDMSVSFQNANRPGALLSDAMAVINAVRLQRDRDAHNRLIEDGKTNKKVVKIDTGLAHWLNFTMSAAEKEDLYLAGLKRARDLIVTGE